MTATSPTAAPKRVGTSPSKKPLLSPQASRGFLDDDPITLDLVTNEKIESEQHRSLLLKIFAQTITIAVLAALILFSGPFFQPVYHYYAVDPAGQVASLTGLTAPNMTNQAVLSWSINAVTEIMTIGFGDFETKLNRQRLRFTPEGWDSFRRGFLKQDIAATFKRNQLVLTTVPSNVPVILSQGRNPDNVYEWKIQLPVIMTYTTNNNMTSRQHSIVTLTIVRVSTTHNPDGIAIKTWHS